MRSLLPLLCLSLLMFACSNDAQSSTRLQEVENRISERLRSDVERSEFVWGSPIFIRIFKQTNELELWLQQESKEFSLYKTYSICNWSGNLGPKLKEGDQQSPEGFYFITPDSMNPKSTFHLSFNLGFPNAYDRAHGRTGSFLMVHGDCQSVGCYAMTDKGIEEIYLLAKAAFQNGQPFFRTHIFPFRMTDTNINAHKNHEWIGFWQNLKTGHDWFEEKQTPPNVTVRNKAYQFSE